MNTWSTGYIGHFGTYFASYDWVRDDQPGKRTRGEYPYSFDDHFLWRKFDKNNPPAGMHVVYSDRMYEQNPEKADPVLRTFGIEDLSREDACSIIERFYDGEAECIGYALSCNRANGNPIGVFYLVSKAGNRQPG